jgi:hypothetical protein
MPRFPDHCGFAFTIFDDTDFSTVENTRPVYDFLSDLGMRTTKSVWPLPSIPQACIRGETLQNPEYLGFVQGIKQKGFEIALHNVRNFDSPRDMVCSGLETFRERLGEYPRTHTNHAENRDNLYWGPERMSDGVLRLVFRVADAARARPTSEGHVAGSSYFWGDICRERLSYVRSFSFREINLDRISPTLPYYDPERPFVNFWFTSSEGADVKSFCKTVAEPEQDRLEQEGGVCIMYSHLSQGFCSSGRINQRFRELMTRMAQKKGWFVPVVTLLDHLQKGKKNLTLPREQRVRMERRWMMEKIWNGTS